MTTMPPRDGNGQDLPTSVPPMLSSTIEDLLVQVEHEYACRRREARALRRRIRCQRLRKQPMRVRAIRCAIKVGTVGLSLIGMVAFAAAVVVYILGDTIAARDLFALAASAWGGVAAVKILSRT